jgi:ABC-type nitrate/sulfonate/bicarbonate transport system substrate-binding protein
MLMIKNSHAIGGSAAFGRKLRLGFVPLADCAPVAAAQELDLFSKYGLAVELSRELGWASLRDKIIHRELEAAHALAPMPAAAILGLGSPPCDCLAALVLSLHGTAITLSEELWQRGVRDGRTLREAVFQARGSKHFTFGVVFPVSSHRHLLRRWLAANGIDPERDVRLVTVPPPQMAANLKAGNLDGFCAGEPWNSAAVQLQAGWIVAAGAQLDPLYPEKVLMVRSDFAAENAGEHLALVAALLEACEFCDDPRNHELLIRWLARPEYVGVDEASLRPGITGRMDWGHDLKYCQNDFCVFHRGDANEPSGRKAAWVLDLLRDGGYRAEPSAIDFALARQFFRPDIYGAAVELRRQMGGRGSDRRRAEFETTAA